MSGDNIKKPKLGLYVGGVFGLAGIGIMALTTPFVLPALRKHCLPYVPATDNQLANISKALVKHAKQGQNFLDVGSGDGRICRLAAQHETTFTKIHGVELNYILVLFSRMVSWKSGQSSRVRYYHKNLWQFPINRYDNICIFGVESMMKPLQNFMIESNSKPQTIFACRFPFDNMKSIDEIGEGIDTVWVYKLP